MRNVFTVFVPKANANYTFNVSELPESAVEYVTDYGFTQAVVDATAGLVRKNFTGTDDEFRTEAKKLADARVAKIKSGQINMRGPVDPFALMASTLGITVDELKKRLGQVPESTLIKKPAKVA